jgi:putative hemolysin
MQRIPKEQIKYIDLDKIVREKAGKNNRYIPNFLIGALKKLIHQDWLNTCLEKGYQGVDFCTYCIEFLDATIEVVHPENFPPASGRYTFVSNHPLGGLDGVTLGSIIGKQYDGKVRYLVNDLLMNLQGLAPLCVPINGTNLDKRKQARNLPEILHEAFESDNQIIMFPAGLCSRKTNGVIRDLPWKKSCITLSVESHRDIVPIHFEGRNSNRFYRIANLCKRLGLKFNLAMLFLPDEMHKNLHKTFRVTIGKPIPWQTFDKSKSPAQWAQYVQDIVYNLG